MYMKYLDTTSIRKYVLELQNHQLSYGPRREKTFLRWFANNTDADQPAYPRKLISAFSGGFRGGGALGASAPPAESMVKNLNLPFFFSMYGRYLFACFVNPV